jgi:hypothetical protein
MFELTPRRRRYFQQLVVGTLLVLLLSFVGWQLALVH